MSILPRSLSTLPLSAPLTSEISASALAALGTNPHGLCCLVAKKADADAMFVAQSMTGNIEHLQ